MKQKRKLTNQEIDKVLDIAMNLRIGKPTPKKETKQAELVNVCKQIADKKDQEFRNWCTEMVTEMEAIAADMKNYRNSF